MPKAKVTKPVTVHATADVGNPARDAAVTVVAGKSAAIEAPLLHAPAAPVAQGSLAPPPAPPPAAGSNTAWVTTLGESGSPVPGMAITLLRYAVDNRFSLLGNRDIADKFADARQLAGLPAVGRAALDQRVSYMRALAGCIWEIRDDCKANAPDMAADALAHEIWNDRKVRAAAQTFGVGADGVEVVTLVLKQSWKPLRSNKAAAGQTTSRAAPVHNGGAPKKTKTVILDDSSNDSVSADEASNEPWAAAIAAMKTQMDDVVRRYKKQKDALRVLQADVASIKAQLNPGPSANDSSS